MYGSFTKLQSLLTVDTLGIFDILLHEKFFVILSNKCDGFEVVWG